MIPAGLLFSTVREIADLMSSLLFSNRIVISGMPIVIRAAQLDSAVQMLRKAK